MGLKQIGFREPGLATRQQQRDFAKLNVNHPCNLPRQEAANLMPGFVIADDVLDLAKLDQAVRMMQAVRPMEPRWHLGQVRPLDQLYHKPAEVQAMRDLAEKARQQALMSMAGITDPETDSQRAAKLAAAKSLAIRVGKLTQGLRDAYALVYEHDGVWACSANSNPHADAIKAFMAEHGWKHAGSGHFSLAFIKDALCIKVGLKAEDSGAAYAAFARDNLGIKGLPVIHDLQRHGKNSYTVVMPKYNPLSARDSNRLNRGDRRNTFLDWGVVGAYDRIEAFFRGMAEIDLHGENGMLDDIGEYIITDPVSFIAGARPGR